VSGVFFLRRNTLIYRGKHIPAPVLVLLCKACFHFVLKYAELSLISSLYFNN
jgi:hypothetical protein